MVDINVTLCWKCCHADFSSVLEPLTGSFLEGVLKYEFSGIQHITCFGINNFGHIEAMNAIFFSKCSKFYVDFETPIKVGDDVDGFEDNCVWTCCRRFCQLWQKYMWSTNNAVKSVPKISDPTKRHDTQLNFVDNNGTLD